MRSILLVSTCLLLACSEIPTQKSGVSGEFVDIGAAKFAVFSEGESALAIYIGALRAPDEDWVMPAAQRAIERATGCPVIPDSLQSDSKTIQANLDCSRTTALFVRARDTDRGRGARSGLGPSASELVRLRQQDDAAQ